MTEPKISVGIIEAASIRFDLYGEYLLKGFSKPLNGEFEAKINSGKIIVLQNGAQIAEESEILFKPSDVESDSFLLYDVIIGKDFHWMKKEKQRFRGSIKLVLNNNQIHAINFISLEDYLTSVISSEMNPNCSIESLKAHSIISRSWLLAQLDKKKNKEESITTSHITEQEIIRWYDRQDHQLYDFCADDHCQRYQGVSKVFNDNANAAVMATRGYVLMHNNNICDTRFSKCCGGITEAFHNVWENEKHEYLDCNFDYKFELDGVSFDLTTEEDFTRWVRSSPNAYCNTSDPRILSQVLVDFDRSTTDFFRWKVEYSQEELKSIITEKSGIDFGDLIEFEPIERGGSGRLIKLEIVGSKKTITIGKELEIRRILSKTHLYSSAFIITAQNFINGIPQNFVIEGAGWGHGVGLCQIGAAVMSELGHGFDEILLHYFRSAKIQKIY